MDRQHLRGSQHGARVCPERTLVRYGLLYENNGDELVPLWSLSQEVLSWWMMVMLSFLGLEVFLETAHNRCILSLLSEICLGYNGQVAVRSS